MTTSKKKKKKESIFMRKSFLKVYTGKDGTIHSKARGSLDQNINNFNFMISYLKEQASGMAGSVYMTNGTMPDCIVGTTTKNPRIKPEEYRGYGIKPSINPDPSPNSIGK